MGTLLIWHLTVCCKLGVVVNLDPWEVAVKNIQTEQKRIQTEILHGENGRPVALPDLP